MRQGKPIGKFVLLTSGYPGSAVKGFSPVTTDNVIIGLGSNLGDSARILLAAWHLLGEDAAVTLGELSPPYISSPVDMTSNHWFTNAVGRLQTSCTPHELLDLLRATEQELGRTREKGRTGYQDRSIDLDLIYFDTVVMDGPHLTLPHPHRMERLFVLAPLAAIAPDFRDPVAGVSVSRLHRDLLLKIGENRIEKQELSAVSWPDKP